MKLSLSVRYGAACLFELSQSPEKFLDAQNMATRLNIPSAYIHKILQTLSRAGFISGMKGVGYQLSRPLDQISAREVIETLSKESSDVSSPSDMGSLLEKKVNEALESFTLDDLISSKKFEDHSNVKNRYWEKISRVTAGILFALIIRSFSWAGDVDVKLTTNNGTTAFTVQDSGGVGVSTITSNGDATFNTITQVGIGGNVIVSTPALQAGATFYVSSGTVAERLYVGNVMSIGNPTAYSDNYLAFPMTSGAAITTKQAVVMNTAGQVVTTNVASSVTVVGITVTATSGSGQTIYVATAGIVTNVPCASTMATGVRACTSTTLGDIGTCASGTNDAAGIGKMLTSCTAASAGTILLLSQ
jgi:Rrf2 family protein